MIHGFIETQRAPATILAFFATYFIALTIGRFLKRRAGVPLGLAFQVFCLALAFYTGMRVYGVRADLGNHVGAVLILLSTAIVVALIDRYVWDAYFERRKQTTIPKLLREMAALLIFLIALLIVLSVGYHAER